MPCADRRRREADRIQPMAELRLSGGALDGLTLHYVSAGRGPAVVLLHGLGGFAESWRRTVDALAPRHTVIAVDLPGFGHSAKPRTRYGLGFFAGAQIGRASCRERV